MEVTRSLWSILSGSLSNPRGAVVYATVVCVIGMAAGALAAEAHTRHTTDSLRSRYVQSIDPFAGENQMP